MTQPESSAMCAFISSSAYPANENCMLQSHNDVAVRELATAPNVIHEMDLINRLNRPVVLPLPTIQAVASIQLPASQAEPVMPAAGSAVTLVGLLLSLILF